jgi:hypothetical protein
MARGCRTIVPIGLALVGISLAGSLAIGRDTEEQLLQRIQSEPNPIKKAKEEIKLADLKLSQVQDAYSQGHVEEGAKQLEALIDTVKTTVKTLQDSGRNAAKQPAGFRDLEISIREDIRVLQDLARTVAYFDRAPLEGAVQDLDQLQARVIHSLFPGGTPRTIKGPPTSPTVESPGNATEAR